MTSVAAAIDDPKPDANPALNGDEDDEDQELNEANADGGANGQGSVLCSLAYGGTVLGLQFICYLNRIQLPMAMRKRRRKRKSRRKRLRRLGRVSLLEWGSLNSSQMVFTPRARSKSTKTSKWDFYSISYTFII